VGVWVGGCFFSPNDVSGLRRPKNIKGGVYYEDDVRTYISGKSLLIAAFKFAKRPQK